MTNYVLGLGVLTLPVALGSGDPLLGAIILGFMALGLSLK
jgi:hypothetical protein